MSFQRALEEARQNWLSAGGDGEQAALAPHIRAPLGLPCVEAGGGRARWEGAMAWAAETTPTIASRFAGSPGETTFDVPDELRLAGDLTEARTKQLWREFVWRNHPDRQPPGERRDADARVAAANALYDRARREMARKG
ncbi:MAG TPA: hypothetical protein VMI72_04625 [Roseiarcus sp.]|nr:hypothetical protein [Roseiarcus sp.]